MSYIKGEIGLAILGPSNKFHAETMIDSIKHEEVEEDEL